MKNEPSTPAKILAGIFVAIILAVVAAAAYRLIRWILGV